MDKQVTEHVLSITRHSQTLNLAYNHIRALDTGFLTSLKDLQVLHLEGNSFLAMPSAALRGLKSLKVLTLQENDIGEYGS